MNERRASRSLARAVIGPGLLVMLADADAGNVVAAASAGAQWGFRLLPLLALVTPALYLFQELTIRLGLATGEGFSEAVAQKFGRNWALALGLILFVSSVGNLVAQFSGLAGIIDLWGFFRAPLLGVVAIGVVVLLATNSYRRVERIALFIALFEGAFFLGAWKAGSAGGDWSELARQIADQPLKNPDFRLSAAALVGAVFNPWMIFYQQSAVVERRLTRENFSAECLETGVGAVLSQGLTAAMLICGAAAVGNDLSLSSIGEIAKALTPIFGEGGGRIIFSLGVIGAALTSIIVSSLTVAWALGEAFGRHHLKTPRAERRFGLFIGVQGVAILAVAALVAANSDLIFLNLASQALNAVLLPLVLIFLFALARRALPKTLRPRKIFWLAATLGGVAVGAIGFFGGLAGLAN